MERRKSARLGRRLAASPAGTRRATALPRRTRTTSSPAATSSSRLLSFWRASLTLTVRMGSSCTLQVYTTITRLARPCRDPLAERCERIHAAVVPGGIGGLQLTGRRAARDAEGGEAGRQAPGGGTGQGGALQAAAPGREDLRQPAEIGQRVDADGAETGRGAH